MKMPLSALRAMGKFILISMNVMIVIVLTLFVWVNSRRHWNDVSVINKSSHEIESLSVKLGRGVDSIKAEKINVGGRVSGRLAQGGDDSFIATVKLADGRQIEMSDGYVTNGEDAKVVIGVYDDKVEIISHDFDLSY